MEDKCFTYFIILFNLVNPLPENLPAPMEDKCFTYFIILFNLVKNNKIIASPN